MFTMGDLLSISLFSSDEDGLHIDRMLDFKIMSAIDCMSRRSSQITQREAETIWEQLRPFIDKMDRDYTFDSLSREEQEYYRKEGYGRITGCVDVTSISTTKGMTIIEDDLFAIIDPRWEDFIMSLNKLFIEKRIDMGPILREIKL